MQRGCNAVRREQGWASSVLENNIYNGARKRKDTRERSQTEECRLHATHWAPARFGQQLLGLVYLNSKREC